jgi:deazaflavin-dependent oxidoreductase (nitroreductase family)
MPTLRQRARNNPFIAKQLFRLQVFLIRRNWAKRLGTIAMVITTTGRKTGRPRSTPIGYLRDGDSVLAFTYPHHHWYKNLRQKPEALLTIQGRKIPVRAELVDDEAGRRRVLEAYQRGRPGSFARMYKLAPDAPLDEIVKAAKDRVFVRFRPRAGA